MKRKYTFLKLLCFLFLCNLPGKLNAQCNLSLSYSVTESRCKSTGSIEITVNGGSGNYNYKITGGSIPPINTSANLITGIPAGTYTVEVKDVTDNCIISQANIVVPGNYQDPRFELSGTDVTCINGSDGTITVTNQQFGTGPFVYTIVAPSASGVGTSNATGVFTGLIPGDYAIRLVDSCGGIQQRLITIANYNWWISSAPVSVFDCDSAAITVNLTDNKANNNSSGSSFAGFIYGAVITPGDTIWSVNRNFNVLKGAARSFAIVAKDPCGNIKSTGWTENNKPSVGANISISNQVCNTFTASVTGQTNLTNPQYCLYDNSNNLIGCNNTGVFNNVPYGSYCINTEDVCYDTIIVRCFTVNQPVPGVGSTVATGNLSCSTFTASITGQTNLINPQYCLFDNANILVSCNNTGVFDNIPYGSYCIQVTDGCTGTVINRCFTRTVPIPAVNATINITNRDCGTFTGSVTGIVNLNNAQFCIYDNLNNLITCNTTGVFNGLPYGSYCIEITNDAACYDTTIVRCFNVNPSQPSVGNAVSIGNKTCTGFRATINNQNNLTNPQFCLYDNSNNLVSCNNTGVFNNIPYGSYCIETTNDAACYDTIITRCFTVTQPIPSVGASVSIANKACSTFSASITGKSNLTNPQYCLYDAGNNLVTCNTSGNFNGIPYGSYCIEITNDAACYDTTITRCFSASPNSMNIGVTSNASCTIGSTDLVGNWTSTASPYTIEVFNPGNVLVYSAITNNSNTTINGLAGLPPGLQYKVVISDNCNGRDSVLVTPQASWLNKSINANSKCPGGEWQNGSGDLLVSCEYSEGSVTPKIIRKNGGVVNITHNSSNGINYTFTEMEPATYVVEYTLQNCSTKQYDTFDLSPYSFPDLQQSAVYQCNDNSFSVSSAVSGGLTPFTYEIIGSVPSSPSIISPPQNSPVFSIDNNNTYGLVRLRAIDACGNATTNDASVLPLANAIINASSNCFYNNIVLGVDTIPNATYTWYRKTSATDSVLVGNSQSFNIPYLLPTDTGTYVCEVSVNGGCLTRISGFTLDGACGIPLPGNNLQFAGSLKNNQAALNWTTNKEYVADEFIVERSADGVNFTAVGSVKAVHNGTGSQNRYYFTHTTPEAGKNYYRLRVMKGNNTVAFSGLVLVTLNDETSIIVSPNPADADVTIRFTRIVPGNYSVSLFSSDGKIQMSAKYSVRSGDIKTLQRPGSIKAGICYLVILNTATGDRKVVSLLFR